MYAFLCMFNVYFVYIIIIHTVMTLLAGNIGQRPRCFVAYLFASSLGVKVSGGFLSVCPIHFNFLFFVSFYMGRCLAIFQSLSVHFRYKILRKHLLRKVCILSV